MNRIGSWTPAELHMGSKPLAETRFGMKLSNNPPELRAGRFGSASRQQNMLDDEQGACMISELTHRKSMEELRTMIKSTQEDFKDQVRRDLERHEDLLRSIHSSLERGPARESRGGSGGSFISNGSQVRKLPESPSKLSVAFDESHESSTHTQRPESPSAQDEGALKPALKTCPTVVSLGTNAESPPDSVFGGSSGCRETGEWSSTRTSARRRSRRFSTEGGSFHVKLARNLMASQSCALGLYRIICVLVIILDAALVTMETDHAAINSSVAGPFESIGYGIVVWYVLELFGTVYRTGPWAFLLGKDALWNRLQLVLTVAAVLEVSIKNPNFIIGMILREMRLVRLLRIIRLLRPFQFLDFLREFHKLVLCLAASARTLWPAMCLMTFIIFCVGILFTRAVADHLHDPQQQVDSAVREELTKHFGSVADSMLSMSMAMTAGQNWGEHFWLLEAVSPYLALLFVFFLMIIIYGLTNVVTAIFVESAMQATQHHKDLLVQRMLVKERLNVMHMKEIFNSIDSDGSGAINREEMAAFLNNDGFALQEYFEALDLSVTDAETLFNLLDTDSSGEVDIDEFCDGCIRLGGNAKSFDINCMWHEQRRAHKEMLRLLLHACTLLQSLGRHCDEMPDFKAMADRVEQMIQSSNLRHSSNRTWSRQESVDRPFPSRQVTPTTPPRPACGKEELKVFAATSNQDTNLEETTPPQMRVSPPAFMPQLTAIQRCTL